MNSDLAIVEMNRMMKLWIFLMMMISKMTTRMSLICKIKICKIMMMEMTSRRRMTDSKMMTMKIRIRN